MKKILLVEDDPILGKGLKIGLEMDSYHVVWKDSIEGARQAIITEEFDLILLDLNLPDGSGLDFAKLCQDKKLPTPIIMLTASGDEVSVVAGFDAGAKDYVRKPFSNKELRARIKVAMSEAKNKMSTLHYEQLLIFPDKRLVKYGERSVELNRREFDILAYLVEHAESVISRESLLQVVNREGEIFDRTIDSHVSHLRSRLRKNGITAVQISSVYGVGYRLEKKND